ncbi:hypothetical protein DL98DRAFT_523340 [Cadophora sp. DSE1049]|nr:hypothetical protein DL98DRAFT_523340 [Cadophora sp. DSE1049]
MSSAPSSVAPDQSSQATSDAVTAPSIGKAATGSPLVRTILEAYGKEILESASEQFLDLALEGGNANSRSKPDAIGTPKPPGAIADQRGPHSATSSQPLSLKKARAPNHTNTAQVLRDEPLSANTHLTAQRAAPSAKEGGYSIQSIQGVAARVARSRNASKRGLAQDTRGGVQSQRPRKLVRASAAKSSPSISAQPLELVVISDSEPEFEDNGDH